MTKIFICELGLIFFFNYLTLWNQTDLFKLIRSIGNQGHSSCSSTVFIKKQLRKKLDIDLHVYLMKLSCISSSNKNSQKIFQFEFTKNNLAKL